MNTPVYIECADSLVVLEFLKERLESFAVFVSKNSSASMKAIQV